MYMRPTMIMARFVATAAGSGYSPVAPGTAGSLLAAFAWWGWTGMAGRFGWDPGIGMVLSLSWIALVLAAGVWASEQMIPEWGKDPSRVVVDEVVGTWIALLLLPREWPAFALGLCLFRLFDIWKPLGIRRMERWPGAWGIMLDDVLAGIYAAVLGHAILHSYG
jgi:phosphatidylglycerophosphatase A